jgi:hypothetical protein
MRTIVHGDRVPSLALQWAPPRQYNLVSLCQNMFDNGLPSHSQRQMQTANVKILRGKAIEY